MGMALQHAVDLLDALPKNCNVYGVNNIGCSDFFRNKLLKITLTGDSMDRRLEQFNRESVRMTLLKHEETFKEQVRELHRLYKVQKMLMAELRNTAPKLHSSTTPSSQTVRTGGKSVDTEYRTGLWATTTSSETNQTPFCNSNNNSSNQLNSVYNFHPLFSMRADPSLQEQSSSCSRDTCKTPKGFDLEQPPEEISTNISASEDQIEPNSMRSQKYYMNTNSSCDPCFYNDGENDVELTLSIGFGTAKKNSKNRKAHLSRELGCSSSNKRQMDPSLSVRSDRGDECSDPTNSPGSASATCDRESLQQPPWLLQSLSLNRT